jgi:hypothetical protein
VGDSYDGKRGSIIEIDLVPLLLRDIYRPKHPNLPTLSNRTFRAPITHHSDV